MYKYTAEFRKSSQCDSILCQKGGWLFLILLCNIHVGLVSAYETRVSNYEKPGKVIFKAGLGLGWHYSIKPIDGTDPRISSFFEIHPTEGDVSLKHHIRCGSLFQSRYSFGVEARSLLKSSVLTNYTSFPLHIYIRGEGCHLRYSGSSMSSSWKNQQVFLESSDACLKKNNTIVNLYRYIPKSLLSCDLKFRVPASQDVTVNDHTGDVSVTRHICIDNQYLKLNFSISSTCGNSQNSVHAINIVLTHGDVELTVVGDNFLVPSKVHMRRKRMAQRNRAPFFPSSVYTINVPEEMEPGYVVTSVSATDPDGDTLTYSMIAVHDGRSQNMFAIDPTSGQITTTQKLDREKMTMHYFRVTVKDNGDLQLHGTAMLTVNVDDTNDHGPVFESSEYSRDIRESATIGSTIVTVRATDQDQGSNAEIVYSILNPEGPNQAFRIDPRSGVVTTRQRLDRERIANYNLEIEASDQAAVSDRKRSTTLLKVGVLDDNDNYPQFEEKNYAIEIPENTDWLDNPVVAHVRASDADEGQNSVIRYSLIGGNTQGHFSIDSVSGDVSVVSPLDYETVRSYRLVVRAQDNGSPSRSNTTFVTVTILDKNDNDPKFYTSLFTESVSENVDVGYSIVRVQAFDSDGSKNSQIIYTIERAPENMPLMVDKNEGWITTNRELDREEAEAYNFVVVATDKGVPPRSASASVIINVRDINDNDPIFNPKVCKISNLFIFIIIFALSEI